MKNDVLVFIISLSFQIQLSNHHYQSAPYAQAVFIEIILSIVLSETNL